MRCFCAFRWSRSCVSHRAGLARRRRRSPYIKTAYDNAVAAAKLDDVNFHTLRHTFASWAIMRGVTLKELQELLGHASLTMTMRYAHLAPEHLRTAVGRLDGLTRQQPAPTHRTEKITQEITHEAVALIGVPRSS